MTTETDSDIRSEAIITAAVEQVRALLETHFRDVTKAACDSFVGDDNTTEPVASASVSVKWSALAAAPKIAVKIGWSVKYSDESETEIDPLQSKLGLDEFSPGAVAAARKLVKTVRDADATMTMKTGDTEVTFK